MPQWPLQALERVRPARHVVVRRWDVDVLELPVGLEVRLDEVLSGGRGDDLRRATFEELRYAADVVVVTMSADDVVLAVTGWVERCVAIVFDGVIFDIVPKVHVSILQCSQPNVLFEELTLIRWQDIRDSNVTNDTGSIGNMVP